MLALIGWQKKLREACHNNTVAPRMAPGYRLVGEEGSRRRSQAKVTIERASPSELSCLFGGSESVPWAFTCQLRMLINQSSSSGN